MKILLALLVALFSLAPGVFSQVEFTAHTITTNKGGKSIMKYGQQNFVQHTIHRYPVLGAAQLYAIDMDSDGDTDLLSVSPYQWFILWHENDGSGNFINHVIHSIPSTTNFGYSVWPADLDNDGDYDMVTGAVDSPEIRWLENDGSNSNFTIHIVDTLGLRTTTIFSDLDEDGDFDILAASQYPGAVVWYENNGSQQFVKHPLPDVPMLPRNILARDLDQDGDTDIVTSDYGDIFSWLENDGEENFTKHKIPGTRRSNGLFIEDLDQDGDWDIVTGYPHPGDKMVVWLENDGRQNFTEHVIETNIDWTECTWASDVDLDGDIDVLSASQYDHKVVWYESVIIYKRFAHADSVYIAGENDNLFVKSGHDTLFISSHVYNPFNSRLQVEAHIFNDDSTVSYSVPLADMGDDVWRTDWFVPEGERNYTLLIQTSNLDSNTVTNNPTGSNKIFTTKGPVVVDEYEFSQVETDLFELKYMLRNAGASATISGITAQLVSTDSNVVRISTRFNTSNTLEFPPLDPGESSVNRLRDVHRIQVTGNADCIGFRVNIFSNGTFFWSDSIRLELGSCGNTSVNQPDEIPLEFSLSLNYPNPFNPSTIINYSLPSASQVELRIYNTLGQEIRTLVNSTLPPGSHQTVWDGQDNLGNAAPSGVYFYQLQAGAVVETRKMVLIQ